MKIKKINVIGFKSFMERATLTFPEKVTAIVGPNGCGKSNIVDAIRWVIGEQSSKHLRGKGMEDMIFSGSEQFSPLGMAEVRITFTNDNINVPVDYSEYSEITVSRRLYKSGESEYKINNTKCRLMDIRELFMDTGISAKAYAIIEQGKVDTIVNSKPEDKRVIIEEAAGITKYKNRKESALRKIASTEVNLTRTKDILSEIKKQLNSVERQAKRAEQFKKFRGQFKEIELKLLCIEHKKVSDHLGSMEKQLKAQDDISIEVSKKLKVKENELEAMKIKSLDMEKELSETQELYLNRLNEIRKKETEIEFKERRKDELFTQKNNNLSEIEDLKSTIKGLKVEKEAAKNRLRSAESEFLKEEKRVFALQKEYEELTRTIKEKTGQIDKERSRLVNLYSNIAHTKNDTANFESHLESFTQTRDKLKKEADFLSERILKVTKDLKDFDHADSTIETEKRDLNNKSLQNEMKLSELDEDYDAKEETKTALENELKEAEARHNSLNELKNSYEGFNAGVKSIMKEKKKLGLVDDILGVVTDFIEVEPEYETAVSSYLGERLEYVVVKNKKAVLKSVEYLKENDLGKAGFVLVENCKPKKGASLDKSRFSNIVKIKDGFAGAFKDMFNDVHYEDKFDKALKQYQNSGKKTYITKDGDIINDMIFGGSKSAKSEKILSREREIKELSKKVVELTRKLGQEVKALDKLKAEIDETEEKQETLRDSLHDVEIKSIELKNRINGIKDESDRLSGRNDIIKFELDELKAQMDDMHNKLLMSKVKHEEFLAEKEKVEKSIAKSSAECERLNGKLDEKSEELTVSRVNVARYKVEQENIARTITHFKDSIDSDTLRVNKLKNGIEIIDREEADIKTSVKTIESELKQTISLSEKDKKGVEKLKDTYQRNLELIRKEDLSSSGIKNELTDIINKKNELTLKREEAHMNLRNLQEKLREKYQKTLHDLDSIIIEDDFNKNSAVKRLEILRSKIYDMGEVNLLAIEEFEELNERYTFLMEQRQDLLKSISTLNKAIKRINKTSKKRFKETFDLVSEKFISIFPRLFNGGHAELRLSDEEDLLETGVEIVAQPPGKKLQNISLLSGGEKALTAVSLIFAIFMIKPSPFCLLDEVDAPLDDANIGRFTDLVKEMSETSQFIIITHSKRTMEIADTLYGVTMENPGISKIVSVQMN